MKKIAFRQLAYIMLILCFITGTVGAAYNVCNMDKPEVVEQAMEGMDCHKQDSAPKKNNCCFDFSCPKCFSLPLNMAKNFPEAPRVMLASLLLHTSDHLSHYKPAVLERPPKIG